MNHEILFDELKNTEDAPLRRKVLIDLFDKSPSDPEVIETENEIPFSPWVRATLDAYNGDGTWGKGFYSKYQGTSWVLLHLSEIMAPLITSEIEAGLDYLVETSKPVATLKGAIAKRNKGNESAKFWYYPIPCLSAHMATVMSRFGRYDEPVVKDALEYVRFHFFKEEGIDCYVMENSLNPMCFMTVPKALKAFLAIPEDVRSEEDQKIINDICYLLKKYNLNRYKARDYKEWADWAITVSASERRMQRILWAEEGRTEPRQAKAGWTRFSFPHNYNSDILEILYLFAQAGLEPDPVIEEGLKIVLSKRKKNGWWNMVGGQNGKMYADIDVKGKPSPWITYRALYVLKHFGWLDRFV